MATFFNSFRKGPVVCRGLDVNFSGKVAKKTTLTPWHRKEVATPTMCSPSYHCVRNLSPSTTKAAATAYTHINVAIVMRLHFGNAKPKFHMNCWPTISINNRSCQQHCITRPANILTFTYSFIFTIHKSTSKQQRNAHPYSYLYAQWTIEQN